jgi:hypothetical protein
MAILGPKIEKISLDDYWSIVERRLKREAEKA